MATPLDPFTLKPDLFALELIEFQVVPRDDIGADAQAAVRETARVLWLNHPPFCKLREHYVTEYEEGPETGGISFANLMRRAPFIARELRRQGRLVRGDK